MALSAKMDVTPFMEKAGVSPPSVYLMVGTYSPDRLRGGMNVLFVRFPNAAARMAFKDAQATMDKLRDAMVTLQIKRVTAKTPQDSQALEAELGVAQNAYQTAAKAQQDSGGEDDPKPEGISRENMAQIVNDDGDVVVAKLYTFLKTLDRFKDATDL